MKYCPQCQKQYTENWITFCPDDGAILIDTGYSPNPNAMPGSQRPSYVPLGSEQPTWQVQDPNALGNWRSPDPNAPGAWIPPQPVTPAWQPPPPPATYPRRQQQSSGFAVASMIVGILSLLLGMFCLGPIPGIAALILGLVALSQIKKAPDRNGGKPFAIVGIVTGSISLVVFGIWLLVIIIANLAS
ncbi:MAG TPA: DUF4190 domain-containing protein [Pyrinomonadaceae bacterium]